MLPRRFFSPLRSTLCRGMRIRDQRDIDDFSRDTVSVLSAESVASSASVRPRNLSMWSSAIDVRSRLGVRSTTIVVDQRYSGEDVSV